MREWFGSRGHEGPPRTRSAKLAQEMRSATNPFVFFVIRGFVILIPHQAKKIRYILRIRVLP
jgi:hypothetical protein